MPFIVRWPGKVEPGSSSDQLICSTDLMATVAEITGKTLPENAAEDSVSFLPAFDNNPIVTSRKGVVHHSISGHFGYREGKWKLLLARGSGGWSSPKEKEARKTKAPIAQLYDLENDPGEASNLYVSYPEVANRLLKQLKSDIESGRSVDGPAAKNDVKKIKLWKSGQE